MTGADLRCPTCGAGARDVALGLDLRRITVGSNGEPLYAKAWAVQWTCTNGHKHLTGDRGADRGIESEPVR